jgi:hypothetical protein
MAPPLDTPRSPPLSETARHGARLAAAGADGPEIARQTGVHPDTVKRWRGRADWRALRDRYAEEVTERVIERATSVRSRALALVEEAIDEGAALLDSVRRRRLDLEREARDPYDADAVMGARELAAVLKAGLDAYKTTAAQTGISETTRTQVEVTAPEEALRQLDERLSRLPRETLRGLTSDD